MRENPSSEITGKWITKKPQKSVELRPKVAQNVTDLVDPTFMHIYGETQAEKERNPRFRYLPPLLQKFQQALVHHENWVGFDSNLSPKQRKYFTEQLFASLPVDFSKVSEASLISLGILEKNTLKNASPEAREEIIKTAISALRRIFLHANAIPGSQRIYEIHDFEPEREERRPPWNGMFLVFQNSETLSDSPKSPGKNTPKKMSDTSFSVYSSVYRVARGMEHSVESLQAAKSQLRTAITELLSTIEIWRVSDPQELKELLQVLYEDLRKKTTPEVINALQARIGLINFSHAQIDTSRLQWAANDLEKAYYSKGQKSKRIIEQAAILEKQLSEQEILCEDFARQVLRRITSLKKLEEIPLPAKEIEKLKMPFQYVTSFLYERKDYPFLGKPFRPFIDDLREMNDSYTKNHSRWDRPKITEELATLASKAHSILQEIQAKD